MIAQQKPKVLLVDDDKNTRETLQRGLKRAGYEIFTAENGSTAIPILQEEEIDCLVTDYKMPDMDGMRLATSARVVRPSVAIIMISAFANVDTAVLAIKQGIFDVFEKPVKLRDVKTAIARALENRLLLIENRRLRADLKGREELDRIVGRAPAFRDALGMVEQVAPVKSTVLLTGESGTGKEIFANALHRLSPRAEQPMIKVHCAALAEGLLEAELFGHEKGAFTGAVASRKGRFELANGGTILLDEIGEIPLSTQVKLLRVLQEGEFERVGGSETIQVDVRIIAATNVDLVQAVADRRFREDLFYRLNVISIEVPSLRDRRSDIPLLVQHFIAKYNALTGKALKGIAPDALDRLVGMDWPGNVRELGERDRARGRAGRRRPRDLGRHRHGIQRLRRRDGKRGRGERDPLPRRPEPRRSRARGDPAHAPGGGGRQGRRRSHPRHRRRHALSPAQGDGSGQRAGRPVGHSS